MPMQLGHSIKVLAVLPIMQNFTDKKMLSHANVVPSLRFRSIDYTDKNAGLKIFSDTQRSCKTTFFIL